MTKIPVHRVRNKRKDASDTRSVTRVIVAARGHDHVAPGKLHPCGTQLLEDGFFRQIFRTCLIRSPGIPQVVPISPRVERNEIMAFVPRVSMKQFEKCLFYPGIYSGGISFSDTRKLGMIHFFHERGQLHGRGVFWGGNTPII